MACRAAVESSVSQVDGVESVRINYWTGKMTVVLDPDRVSDDAIIRAVERKGYTATRIDLCIVASVSKTLACTLYKKHRRVIKWSIPVVFVSSINRCLFKNQIFVMDLNLTKGTQCISIIEDLLF